PFSRFLPPPEHPELLPLLVARPWAGPRRDHLGQVAGRRHLLVHRPRRHLLREGSVGLRAPRARVVDGDRLAVPRRLGESYGPWYDGVIHTPPEVPPDFLHDLLGELRPRVAHRQH